MILYNKAGMFLGMGNQELNLLGYEDMEEFRNYHNDVADLFTNKPGFIFKFKNFSWIDYALHSGTPNRRVLLKTKNGREIEASLLIHEIFLEKELHDAKSCFGIELLSGLLKSEPLPAKETITPSSLSSSAPTFETEPDSFMMEDAPSSSSETAQIFPSYEEESIAFVSPIQTTEDKEIVQEEEPVTEESVPQQTLIEEPVTTPFKLKFDTTILDVPVKIEINEEPISVIPPEPVSKKDTVSSFSFESYPEDQHEDLLNDPTLLVEEASALSIQPEPFKTFDFAQSAEDLGVDFTTLAEIIEDYIVELDTQMSSIEQLIMQGETKMAAEEISKLSIIASHLGVDSLIWHLNTLEQSLEVSSAEDIETLLAQTKKSITEFKDLVQ